MQNGISVASMLRISRAFSRLSAPLSNTLLSELQALRQHLHRYPEPSFQEFNTARTLKEALLGKGILKESVTQCCEPGFFVDIAGEGKETTHSRRIAFRTDMDALKTQEANEDLPYRSCVDGVAHLCGHDGHMTIAVGLAWALHQRKSLIPKNCSVRVIFQPGEESPPGGAIAMVNSGCLSGVDEVYAYHNMNLPEGAFLCRDGKMMSQGTIVSITVKGKGGHGAAPQLSNDCILTSAYIVAQLHSIIPRNVSCFREAILTICQLHAGSAHNVLPDSAAMEGTFRTYDSEVKEVLKQRILTIAKSTAEAHGCTAEVVFRDGYPPAINNPECAKRVRAVAADLFGEDKVLDVDPSSASEDFSYFLQKVPGALVFIGNGTDKSLHISNYVFRDTVLDKGVRLWLRLLEDRFGVEIKP